MALCKKNVEIEHKIMKARDNADNNEEVDDLINIFENQLDYLYNFHKFKLFGRKSTL